VRWVRRVTLVEKVSKELVVKQEQSVKLDQLVLPVSKASWGYLELRATPAQWGKRVSKDNEVHGELKVCPAT